MSIKLTCQHCGKTFQRPPSQAGPYCSRQCANTAIARRQSKHTQTCLACGKQFQESPSRKRRYCSRACSNSVTAAKRRKQVLQTCQSCGKQFLALPSENRIYCSRTCYEAQQDLTGESNPSWKGGRFISDGYVQVWVKDHPYGRKSGQGGSYVYEHRLVMETHLGRYLTPDEVVHHINEDGTDNRLENLMVMSQSEHMKLHAAQRR